MWKFKNILFWFRQDLRVFDNVWLWNAIEDWENVLPVFIFDEKILDRFPQNDKRLWFLKDALIRLDSQLQEKWSRLYSAVGDPQKLLPQIVKENNIDAVYTNRSYWPYWTTRDTNIKKSINAEFCQFEDFFLVKPENVPVRKVFTPFYKQWKNVFEFSWILNIDKKISTMSTSLSTVVDYLDKFDFENLWDVHEWDNILKNFDFCNYENTRNYPFQDWTSKLSPYVRFGLVSIRQVYDAIQKSNCDNDVFLSEIAWREFWNHIAINFPWTENLEFLEKRRWLDWLNEEKLFEAWKEWQTGYPLVDAGMRQLKQESWIHNRVRMVVASFLTKDLLIDRRWWERHFENYLLDYDRNVNIWNWQWASSVWADPKPMRIFNPMLQSQRFDPECKYIKKYIPELENYHPWQIHNPLRYNLSYAKPVVDHFERSKIAKNIYNKQNIDI